jgi:hypothetical protein
MTHTMTNPTTVCTGRHIRHSLCTCALALYLLCQDMCTNPIPLFGTWHTWQLNASLCLGITNNPPPIGVRKDSLVFPLLSFMEITFPSFPERILPSSYVRLASPPNLCQLTSQGFACICAQGMLGSPFPHTPKRGMYGGGHTSAYINRQGPPP